MPYTTTIQVRFRDLDPMKHVNNAVFVTYLEQARADFYEDVLGVALADVDTVITQLEINYEGGIESVGTATVELTTGDVGESSLPMEYEIRTEGEVVATASTVQVFVREDRDASRPIPEEYRAKLE